MYQMCWILFCLQMTQIYFFSHNDMKFLSEITNNELAKLTQLFLGNKLSINLKKSSYIIFRPW